MKIQNVRIIHLTSDFKSNAQRFFVFVHAQFVFLSVIMQFLTCGAMLCQLVLVCMCSTCLRRAQTNEGEVGGCGSTREVNQWEGGSTNSLITEPCHSDRGCRATVSLDWGLSLDGFVQSNHQFKWLHCLTVK